MRHDEAGALHHSNKITFPILIVYSMMFVKVTLRIDVRTPLPSNTNGAATADTASIPHELELETSENADSQMLFSNVHELAMEVAQRTGEMLMTHAHSIPCLAIATPCNG